ncbi:flagellar transcriptional regulator FlhD [Mixta tenebrionis]|jgi:flagellar transcriptional activator FlhD|uniref:Flagellar transcriptional regulator FlhD n=2 Tax=Mixta TaxID=2100764 RepID=A0A6P1Q493_9GAMM|nr:MULTISPECIES: flagellar transcriptional regulator FlhD [Mixta]QHM73211.1 Flagellar transcriptional regulator FlhD [Mixta intestinalis]QHM77496.1 Flagellar transcriptional regulator FlhD [Mixta theicola]TPW40665.1 flagellar transcriptional regulator FlhD [Mixta tenebrionis]
MNKPDSNDQLQSIHNLNLTYLLLAQRLIREDKFAAGFRLGLDTSILDTLSELSLPQLIKMASTSQLICRLRVDDKAVIDCLTKASRIDALQQIHTGIILSTELLNSLSEQNHPTC